LGNYRNRKSITDSAEEPFLLLLLGVSFFGRGTLNSVRFLRRHG